MPNTFRCEITLCRNWHLEANNYELKKYITTKIAFFSLQLVNFNNDSNKKKIGTEKQ
jgi:hypothetical protein